jgi:hypothetical protein
MIKYLFFLFYKYYFPSGLLNHQLIFNSFRVSPDLLFFRSAWIE